MRTLKPNWKMEQKELLKKKNRETNNSHKENPKKESMGKDFIRENVKNYLMTNKDDGRVATRFPPEPNGYLHIGHAKSICLNFGIAAENNDGTCNLRFDDTNPAKESLEYAESIKKDIKWLGFNWGDRQFYSSDYFDELFKYAAKLIEDGKAYVDSLNGEEIRQYRGTLTKPGKESPYRNRSVEENLKFFEDMKAGEFKDGTHVLRAKIDMTHPNLVMRDPILYRIRHTKHYRTGDKWCVYPMYDFAHCISDYIEGITHSICTLEFENNRELYDWILLQINANPRPRQIEFARLNLGFTALSKRKLSILVEKGYVKGWDDPRMPTLSGLKRRGYSPEAIRNFCDLIGVAKRNSVVDMALLEFSIREHLNKKANRVMGVLRPLEVVIDNYPEDKEETLDAVNNPENPDKGSREVPFSRILYIEEEDFMEDPPKKFFRLSLGREVRLRYAYYIKCVQVVKDEQTGKVIRLHCTYDPETKGGWSKDGRKVRGTLHWVSAKHAAKAKVLLYDRLFNVHIPGSNKDGSDFTDDINPNSLEVLENCFVEPSLQDSEPGSVYQFERLGYFCLDSRDLSPDKLVFNRTVTLRDSWAKITGKKK